LDEGGETGVALLDLQGMGIREKGPPPRSRASKGCNLNPSNLSVLCNIL